MIQLRHTGLYVDNLEKESDFYRDVFLMKPLCEKIIQKDKLIEDIFGNVQAAICVTKLITEQGQVSGFDDMLELIKVINAYDIQGCVPPGKLFDLGRQHIAFGVPNMDMILKNLVLSGGQLRTRIHLMDNGNRCCMACDPEGNWLEIIERRN